MCTNNLFQNKQEVHEMYLKFLEKTQESLDKDIDGIVEWIETQPHLPETPSRPMLVYFFKMCKGSIEKTKFHIDMYYTVRTLLMSEVFANSHPRDPEMQEISQKWQVYQIKLPKLTNEGNAVNIFKVRQPLTTKDYLRNLAHQFNVIEVRLAEEISRKDILVYDLENHTLAQLLKITPSVLKIFQLCFKHVFSARTEKIIILNSPVSEKLLMVVKSILSKKLTERIIVLDSREKLFDHVPKEVLPKDYGGDELSLEELDGLWKAKLKEYYTRFDELKEMRVKEELRPTPLNNDEFLGYYGNFKKLDVD